MTARSNDTIRKLDLTVLDRLSAALNAAAKRGMDIFLSALGLLLLSPFFLLVALKLKREEPGPVLYRGPRLGKDGVEFGILKFRTHVRPPGELPGRAHHRQR